jgi:hypothetical protein
MPIGPLITILCKKFCVLTPTNILTLKLRALPVWNIYILKLEVRQYKYGLGWDRWNTKREVQLRYSLASKGRRDNQHGDTQRHKMQPSTSQLSIKIQIKHLKQRHWMPKVVMLCVVLFVIMLSIIMPSVMALCKAIGTCLFAWAHDSGPLGRPSCPWHPRHRSQHPLWHSSGGPSTLYEFHRK